ncbi:MULTISPECIES: RHS repeat-associated core domain-containing protein [Cysteiniphilum]|uniref:RHS repeat-associated core domain-containing protein n=1 Tax=Cysteiniphilum litorale TaxID=2056700 RepID=A0A8J2Z763_9GAMM|nr:MULTISPECIES: RHS repeat-associated core domain-containing protein [Cysteiniphilum]GGG08058.1 hypothetical protein GCM10010995_27020 [Cysteiniphilum litorale]
MNQKNKCYETLLVVISLSSLVLSNIAYATSIPVVSKGLIKHREHSHFSTASDTSVKPLKLGSLPGSMLAMTSGKQNDSMSFGGGGLFSASLNPQTGGLSLSMTLASIPAFAGKVNLSMNYSSNSSGNPLNLGRGWNFALPTYADNYLTIPGHGIFHVTQLNNQMMFEGGKAPHILSFSHLNGEIAGRNYNYVIKLYTGDELYLKDYYIGGDYVAKLIASVDNFGNQTLYYYGDEPNHGTQEVSGLLSQIVSASGNVLKLSHVKGDGGSSNTGDLCDNLNHYNHIDVITSPIAGSVNQKVVSLVSEGGLLSGLCVRNNLDVNKAGLKQDYRLHYDLDDHGVNYIDHIDYPSGKKLVLSHSNNPIMTMGGESMPAYDSLVYEYTDTSNKVHVLKNVEIHSEAGPDKHNFTGYPDYRLSSGEDSLLNAPGGTKYLYEVVQQTNNALSSLTYNNQHLMIEKQVCIRGSCDNSNNIILDTHYRYDGETAGATETPPAFSALSIDTYDKQASQNDTPMWEGKKGDTVTTQTYYNANGQPVEVIYPDGHILKQSYDPKNAALSFKEEIPAPGNSINANAQYVRNIYKSDAYGHYDLSQKLSGYETTGTNAKEIAVYETSYRYDQYGEVIHTEKAYAPGLTAQEKSDLHLGGMVQSMSVDNTVTQSPDVKQLQGLFPAGSYPSVLSGLKVKLVISDASGMSNNLSSSLGSVARIYDQASNLLLYQLSDPIDGRYQHIEAYRYDAFGRMLSHTLSNGQVIQYQYMVGDNKNEEIVTNPAGIKTVEVYDDFGKPVVSYVSDGKQTVVLSSKTYDYDESGSGNIGYGLVTSSVDSSGNEALGFYNLMGGQVVSQRRFFASDGATTASSVYHYQLTDPVHDLGITFSAYGCGSGLCVDSYAVTAKSFTSNEKLASYVFEAGEDGIPATLQVMPKGVFFDYEHDVDAQKIIPAIDKALAAKDWVSHTSYTYDAQRHLIGDSEDINTKGQRFSIHKSYNALGQLIESDNNVPGNPSQAVTGDMDLKAFNYQYNLSGQVIDKKMTSASGSALLADGYYREQHFVYNGVGQLQSITYSGADASGKSVSQTVYSHPVYDAANHLIAHEQANGNIIHTEYNALGQVTSEWVSDSRNNVIANTPAICNVYDPKLDTLTMVYYDVSGNTKAICAEDIKTVMANPLRYKAVRYTVDPLTLNVTDLTYPDGKALHYSYYTNSLSHQLLLTAPASGKQKQIGTLKQLTDIDGDITDYHYSGTASRGSGQLLSAQMILPDHKTLQGSVSYDYTTVITAPKGFICHAGQLCEKHLGNGDMVYYNYAYSKSTNPYHNVREALTVDSTGKEVGRIDYSYDLLGELTEEDVRDALGDGYTLTYAYDAAGRLYQEVRTLKTGAVVTDTYLYDINGNLLKHETTNKADRNYVYNGLDQMEINGGYPYDALGNQTKSITGAYYGYNGWNQLVSYMDATGVKTSYGYLPTGVRYTKSQLLNGQETDLHYYYSNGNLVNTVLGNQSSHYLLAGGDRLQRFITSEGNVQAAGDTDHYYLANFKGSVYGSLDTKGALNVSHWYSAYGVDLGGLQRSASGVKRLSAVAMNTLTLQTDPYGYDGEYKDSESGNIYLLARYYNPITARFISEDSLSKWNRYIFTGSNPVFRTDHSGHSWQNIAILSAMVLSIIVLDTVTDGALTTLLGDIPEETEAVESLTDSLESTVSDITSSGRAGIDMAKGITRKNLIKKPLNFAVNTVGNTSIQFGAGVMDTGSIKGGLSYAGLGQNGKVFVSNALSMFTWAIINLLPEYSVAEMGNDMFSSIMQDEFSEPNNQFLNFFQRRLPAFMAEGVASWGVGKTVSVAYGDKSWNSSDIVNLIFSFFTGSIWDGMTEGLGNYVSNKPRFIRSFTQSFGHTLWGAADNLIPQAITNKVNDKHFNFADNFNSSVSNSQWFGNLFSMFPSEEAADPK